MFRITYSWEVEFDFCSEYVKVWWRITVTASQSAKILKPFFRTHLMFLLFRLGLLSLSYALFWHC